MTGVKFHSGSEGEENKYGWVLLYYKLSLSLGRGGWSVGYTYRLL